MLFKTISVWISRLEPFPFHSGGRGEECARVSMQATSFIPIAYHDSCPFFTPGDPKRSNPWTAKCHAEVQFFLSQFALQKSVFLCRPQCAPVRVPQPVDAHFTCTSYLTLHITKMDTNLITDGTRNGLLCCQVEVYGPISGPEASYQVWCVCVWPWNLNNEAD